MFPYSRTSYQIASSRNSLRPSSSKRNYNESVGVDASIYTKSTKRLLIEKSTAKAQHMQALYELNSDHELSLNKQGNFKVKATEMVFSPSITTISAKEAAAAFQKKEKEYSEKRKNDGPDPLLTSSERKEIQRQKIIAERKAILKATKQSKGRTTALALGRSNYVSIPRQGSKNIHHSALTPRVQRYTEGSMDPSSVLRRNTSEGDRMKSASADIRRTGSGGVFYMLLRPRPRLKAQETVTQTNGSMSMVNNSQAAQKYQCKNVHQRGSAASPLVKKHAQSSECDLGKSHHHSKSMDAIPVREMQSIHHSDPIEYEILNTEKDASSRDKALEMQSMLENTTRRDVSLNKKANFKMKSTEYTCAPKLGEVSHKEAAAIFRRNQAEYRAKQESADPDPLLTENERRKRTLPRKISDTKGRLGKNVEMGLQSRSQSIVRKEGDAIMRKQVGHLERIMLGNQIANEMLVRSLPAIC